CAAPYCAPHALPTRRSSDLGRLGTPRLRRKIGFAHACLYKGQVMPNVAWQEPQVIVDLLAMNLLAQENGMTLPGEHMIAVVSPRSEEHTSELQSRVDLVCRL